MSCSAANYQVDSIHKASFLVLLTMLTLAACCARRPRAEGLDVIPEALVASPPSAGFLATVVGYRKADYDRMRIGVLKGVSGDLASALEDLAPGHFAGRAVATSALLRYWLLRSAGRDRDAAVAIRGDVARDDPRLRLLVALQYYESGGTDSAYRMLLPLWYTLPNAQAALHLALLSIGFGEFEEAQVLLLEVVAVDEEPGTWRARAIGELGKYAASR